MPRTRLYRLTGKTTLEARCPLCEQLVPGVEKRFPTPNGYGYEWMLAEHRTLGCGDRCLAVDLTNRGEKDSDGCCGGCVACVAERERNPRQLNFDDVTDPSIRYLPTGEYPAITG